MLDTKKAKKMLVKVILEDLFSPEIKTADGPLLGWSLLVIHVPDQNNLVSTTEFPKALTGYRM